MLNFQSAQVYHLGLKDVKLLIQCLITALQPVNILQRPLVLGLQVAMQRVQPVQLGLELEAQLDLLLVRSNILVDFLLQLDPQLNLLVKALFKFAVLALHLVHAHFQLRVCF